MAKEVIEVEIKGNTKSATKDVKEYVMTLDEVNEDLKLQKQILHELKGQELELKKARAGMNDYERSLTGIDKKLEEISLETKQQTHHVKGLTDQQKELTKAEKENNTETKESIANLQFMGVSLSGIKKGFSQIIPTAKAMFGTIKAGIMSTGIGALIIAVTSLMAAFKRSEKGQEKFQLIMAGIGAVVDQVMDLFAELGSGIIDTFMNPVDSLKNFAKTIEDFVMSKIQLVIEGTGLMGSALSKLFSGDFSGALSDAGEGFVKLNRGLNPAVVTTELLIDGTQKLVKATGDLIKETSKEVEAINRVTKKRQHAHHIDRKLKVERAKADREINDIRLQAEDRENKSATERIALLRRAQEIEEGITNKEIKSKKILIEAQKLEMAQGKNNIEDKDKLAQLQAELIQLDTKKLRSQRLLQTQITTAVNEEKAQKEELKKQGEADDLALEEKRKREGEILLALQQENTLALIEDLKTRAMEELRIQEEKELASAELMENSELVKAEIKKKFDRKRVEADKKFSKQQVKWSDMTAEQQVGIASSAAGDMATILGEETAAGKAFAIAQTTMDTYASATAAYKSLAGIGPAGPALGAVAAGAAIAAGLANVASIVSTPVPGGGGGGGGGSRGGGGAGAAPPAPQMMSGAFDLSGVTEPEPVKAFVVTDEMTSSQNQLANIRRRATI